MVFLNGIVDQYKQNALKFKHLELMIKNVKVPMSSMLRGKGLQVNLSWNGSSSTDTNVNSVDLERYGFFNDPGIEYGGNPHAGHANHAKGFDIKFNLEPLVEKVQSGQELLAVLRSVLTLKGELFQFDSSRELQTITPGVVDNDGMVTEGDRVVTGSILTDVVQGLIGDPNDKNKANAFLVMTETI